MLAQEVAHKYATALFRSVQQRGLTDQAYEQFRQLQQLLQLDTRLLRFLVAPEIPEHTRLETMRRIFETRLDRLFIEFLGVLMEKGRIRYLPEVVDTFLRLVEQAKGIARATVISAVPLSGEEQQRLTDRLAERLGKTILLETRVDAEILGGMIVMVEGEIIDGSLRHGLERFGEQLQRVRVH